jgi:crossover junction endodeoxyribonuclease RuvC
VKVLGVDPGSRATGYGVIQMEGNRLRHVAHGVIKPNSKAPLPARLAHIFNELRQVIKDHQPDEAGVENIFTARNAQSALKLGHARGVILLAARLEGLPIGEYTPAEVKGAVVGYGRATKEQVQQMVMRLLAMDKTAQEDAADALAVGICHGWSGHTKAAIEQATLRGRIRR